MGDLTWPCHPPLRYISVNVEYDTCWNGMNHYHVLHSLNLLRNLCKAYSGKPGTSVVKKKTMWHRKLLKVDPAVWNGYMTPQKDGEGKAAKERRLALPLQTMAKRKVLPLIPHSAMTKRSENYFSKFVITNLQCLPVQR